jgi:hypothetical protein
MPKNKRLFFAAVKNIILPAEVATYKNYPENFVILIFSFFLAGKYNSYIISYILLI